MIHYNYHKIQKNHDILFFTVIVRKLNRYQKINEPII